MPKATRPKLTQEKQSTRFIETARAAGASEDERDFDAAIRKVARTKSPQTGQGQTRAGAVKRDQA